MTKWLIEYKRERPDVEKLRAQVWQNYSLRIILEFAITNTYRKVDKFMEVFDERVKEEKEDLGKKEVDEEGFELVKRKSRRLRGSLSNPGELRPKKKKKLPLINFYKSQKRQQQVKNTRMNHLVII